MNANMMRLHSCDFTVHNKGESAGFELIEKEAITPIEGLELSERRMSKLQQIYLMALKNKLPFVEGVHVAKTTGHWESQCYIFQDYQKTENVEEDPLP
jgi:hypothetical protein